MLHPKTKRIAKQILPFPIIWVLFAFAYLLVEAGIMGDLNIYPATQNQYDFKGNLAVTIFGCLFFGVIQGALEVLWLRKRFENKALWVKVLLKSFFYAGFIFLFLIVLSTANSLVNSNDGDWNEAIQSSVRFLNKFAFWSVMFYIAFTIVIALFFSEISQYLGDGVFYNFISGKYHRPQKETRIFMFLDMKSSTTIAEQIGHEKYFDLLSAYYGDMTSAILQTSGEIYQYVGDEIVVSWPEKTGLFRNNCIECFYLITRAFQKKADLYQRQFGLRPNFKAGCHIGQVTTGEIGIIKKDIIYTGDVLNTAARIQAECNTYNAQLLLSELLLSKLTLEDDIQFAKIGDLFLRGKKESVLLYSLTFNR
ncbi:adenylate/guanylate cyclase domain-containing protein [Poritiphilus flavus]|uniref:Adenylate/guanylate cyclase domain-containing protein n=1 Tax=Poritiphilus flavus TaxID=2697053 RepID=A0A6L9EAX5_9FLAO|nr:adenylate/guanylate cyclase domain-containing protein [Poritiphilus flavus]NAS11589.1 adenylate/guanylate cyclase domain-containing protein [Poritiphilus flavus]